MSDALKDAMDVLREYDSRHEAHWVARTVNLIGYPVSLRIPGGIHNLTREEAERLYRTLGAALQRPARPPSQSKTVLVRIAVAVDKDGNWVGCGCSCCCNEEAEDTARDNHDDSHGGKAVSLVWVTASVPLPEPQEVQGTVETKEGGS